MRGLPNPVVSRFLYYSFFLVCVCCLHPQAMRADAVPVRHTEGVMHGFVAIHTLDGKKIANGEMTQVAQGDRVTSELVFHFTDGSVYDDATVFTERDRFHLLTDHLITKGPIFKQPADT